MKMKLILFVAFLFLPGVTSHDDGTDHTHNETLSWNILDTRLPTGLSDMTATLGDNGIVYIAGGCNSTNGNEYVDAEGLFVCLSITDTFYSFDIQTQELTTLAPLLQARYRHNAAHVQNQIWLTGGRDLEDNLIAEVEVYDIATNTWSTLGQLPSAYQTSDHGAFAHDTYVYIVGGYTQNYTAHNTTLRLSVDDSNTLVFDRMASIGQSRGDITGVTDGTYAYITGGFTHQNFFCEPLDSVERYSLDNDIWETIAPLNFPRADKALVAMNNRIFAIGGERQIVNICQITSLPDPGEQTIAVKNVEVYQNGEWTVLASLPEHRLRMAGVGWEETSTIYTFGGQAAYDNDCQCFAATNEIVAYVDVDHTSASAIIKTVVGRSIVVTATAVMWMLM
jgi:Galactose oxidase, central domain/Kelch motif